MHSLRRREANIIARRGIKVALCIVLSFEALCPCAPSASARAGGTCMGELTRIRGPISHLANGILVVSPLAAFLVRWRVVRRAGVHVGATGRLAVDGPE